MDSLCSSFSCVHCHQQISTVALGTANRNHCPYCLCSKHVDDKTPGDRKSLCQAPMEPVGLTFKQEGLDKYGKVKQGEIMVVHVCTKCKKLNINRIAGDDDEKVILSLLSQTEISDEIQTTLSTSTIKLLTIKDESEVRKQLFGSHV